MKTSDFYYDLPKELIAQDPLTDRSASRLMVVDRRTGALSHHIFKEIIDYLNPGDCLVINDTKVIPARLHGIKDTGAHAEVLLLKRMGEDTWEALVKPGRKLRTGARISFGEGLLEAEIAEVLPDGNRIVRFFFDGIFEEILDQLGEMPLPPYITHQLKDRDRYQTVYAIHDGSAAAPTAGLHFTKELLAQIEQKGVRIAHVTLHVGLGTFRPVQVDDVDSHVMHSEYYNLDEANADLINRTREQGGRIISVGTTSTRTLETIADERGYVRAQSGWTQIFIYPGYTFKCIDALITNFHLPESTLLMLVSAFSSREIMLNAYREAVDKGYRFFSFGDAMLITDESQIRPIKDGDEPSFGNNI